MTGPEFQFLLALVAGIAVFGYWVWKKTQTKRRSATKKVALAPTGTGVTTAPTSKSFPGWVKALLATVVLLILLFWGETIIPALSLSKIGLGKTIDGATGPGWSNLLWLFLLVPLYFLVGLPKGLAKNAGTVLGWGVAIIGVIGLTWFFTQGGNDGNEVVVDLRGNVTSRTVLMSLDDTFVILIPMRSTGRCKARYETTRRWHARTGVSDQLDAFTAKFENQNTKATVKFEEGFKGALRQWGITTVEVQVELFNC